MKKWLVIFCVIILGLLIGTLIMLSHRNSLSAGIRLEAAPSDSILKIDGKTKEEGLIKVRPGAHSILISKSGFASFSETIKVSKDETKYVGVALISNSSSTSNWYITHPDDAKKAEGISSSNFDISSQDKTKKIPFLKELPWIDQLYRIDYGPSLIRPHDPEAVALYIKYYSETGKQQALDLIKFKGYNPASLEIVFTAANP